MVQNITVFDHINAALPNLNNLFQKHKKSYFCMVANFNLMLFFLYKYVSKINVLIYIILWI